MTENGVLTTFVHVSFCCDSGDGQVREIPRKRRFGIQPDRPSRQPRTPFPRFLNPSSLSTSTVPTQPIPRKSSQSHTFPLLPLSRSLFFLHCPVVVLVWLVFTLVFVIGCMEVNTLWLLSSVCVWRESSELAVSSSSSGGGLASGRTRTFDLEQLDCVPKSGRKHVSFRHLVPSLVLSKIRSGARHESARGWGCV